MPRFRSVLRKSLAPFVGRRGIARDDKGAVAIEFAILALPFFVLIFAILETSIVFLAGQVLDSAVQDASRRIRTGQAQSASWNADNFRAEVCKGLFSIFDCSASKLKVKVSVVSSFATATVSSPIGSSCSTSSTAVQCDWTPEFLAPTYDAGVGSSIVLVQAFYKWPTLANMPGFNMATQMGNTRLLSAVRVFRNEPF